MIKQQANDSSKKYINLSNTAKGAAVELRKKEKEKRDAKDKREQDLRDEGKTNSQIVDDEEVKKLQSEIERLEEEAKQKDQESANDSKKADKEDGKAEESDRRKQRAEKEKNKSRERYMGVTAINSLSGISSFYSHRSKTWRSSACSWTMAHPRWCAIVALQAPTPRSWPSRPRTPRSYKPSSPRLSAARQGPRSSTRLSTSSSTSCMGRTRP